MKIYIVLLAMFSSAAFTAAESGKKFEVKEKALVAKKALGNALSEESSEAIEATPEEEYEKRAREFRVAYAAHLEALKQLPPKDRQAARKAWLESRQEDEADLKALAKQIREKKKSNESPVALEVVPQPSPEIEGKSEEELKRMGVNTEQLHKK